MPTKAVQGETEYRRSFKQSRFSCAATTYQRNLDFRTEQKRRFVEHNPEPFDWDPEDIESDAGSDWSCNLLNKPTRLTMTQYKHEKLNRLYEKRKADLHETAAAPERKSDKEASVQSEKVPTSRDGRSEADEEEGDSGSESDSEESVVHIIGPEGQTQPLKRSDSEVVHVIEPEFPRESAARKHGHQMANKQTQTDRKVIHPVERPLQSPFVPYGYEADVKETGKKLTHNVHAAQEIYPSALRAQHMRRMVGQESRSRSKDGQVLSGKNQQNYLRHTTSEPVRVFVHTDEYEDPEWMSEYDRNFQPYDPNVYMKRPSSARIRAWELVPQSASRTRRQTRQ